MTLLQIIKEIQSQTFTDEDGPFEVEWFPGMTEEEVQAFSRSLPRPLFEDVRELLSYTRGFCGLTADVVDFTGRDILFAQEAIFPHGIPIASDGCGNFWVVDLTPSSTTYGPVYFACHDPPIILFQSADLASFLEELINCYRPPFESSIDAVHQDRLHRVWRTNPGVISTTEARSSTDEHLVQFASTLDSSWSIIDLREAEVGFGFSWGRYGPRTELRRLGDLPIFAYRKPTRRWFR